MPYIFNIIVLVPIGLLTLLGGERGGQLASQGKFPESEGFRTILGSLWTAILLGSVMGLFYPVTMSPLLLIQVIYKTLWLLVFVIPKLLGRRTREVSMGHLADVPGDHREFPVRNSLGAIVRKLMGMRVCGSWTEYRIIVCEVENGGKEHSCF